MNHHGKRNEMEWKRINCYKIKIMKIKKMKRIEKLQLQKRRLRRKRPSKRWKKCNPVRKKKKDECPVRSNFLSWDPWLLPLEYRSSNHWESRTYPQRTRLDKKWKGIETEDKNKVKMKLLWKDFFPMLRLVPQELELENLKIDLETRILNTLFLDYSSFSVILCMPWQDLEEIR